MYFQKVGTSMLHVEFKITQKNVFLNNNNNKQGRGGSKFLEFYV